MVQVLATVTFVYAMQEDRILAAINAGRPDAWSCWLTRRVVLLLLERARQLLANTSVLVQRAPVQLRGDAVAFERDAAMAKTAKRMVQTPPDAIAASAAAAELVKSLSITNQADNFRIEFRGLSGGGADGMFPRAGLQRVLQMLQDEVTKAGWMPSVANSQSGPTAEDALSKRFQ